MNPSFRGSATRSWRSAGTAREALADFAGDSVMTLLRNGQTRRVVGAGAETAGSVRFHQKDPGPDGKDVRVWAITVRGDLFLAEPVPMF